MREINPAAVTVAILAGGLGTRLRAAVADRPKVLAEVNGRPFLSYLLDQVADAGLADVVLCTGYRAEAVPSAFGASYRNLRLRYSPEPSPLGTGGALRFALPHLAAPTVLVLNGDSYTDADLRAFWAQHEAKQAPGSLLLVWMEDAGRYGQVTLGKDGRIQSFQEKQPQAPAGWINAGIYLLPRSWLAALPAERPISLERECFPAWLSRSLQGMAVRNRFLDIGTPESYRQAEEFFQGKQL